MEFLAAFILIVGTVIVFALTAFVVAAIIVKTGRGIRNVAYAASRFGNIEDRLAMAEGRAFSSASARQLDSLWQEVEHIHRVKADKPLLKTKKKS